MCGCRWISRLGSVDGESVSTGRCRCRRSEAEHIGLIAQLVELRTFNRETRVTAEDSREVTKPLEDAGGPSQAVAATDAATNLESAIARLTGALATAADATIGAIVAERKAMRDELAKLRESVTGVVNLASRRKR
jgi:hypothetical protein